MKKIKNFDVNKALRHGLMRHVKILIKRMERDSFEEIHHCFFADEKTNIVRVYKLNKKGDPFVSIRTRELATEEIECAKVRIELKKGAPEDVVKNYNKLRGWILLNEKEN